MRKYQLITDATADVSPEVLKEISELDIIPMEVILDGEPRQYGPDGDCYEEAVKLKEEIEAQLIEAECLIAPVRPIIGIHTDTGPGMIACCFWETKR